MGWQGDKHGPRIEPPPLPAGVCGAWGPVVAATDAALPELPDSASSRRRDEFSSGRRQARRALAAARLPEEIGRDQEGRPVWPAGCAGSISHTRALAAAVVGSSTRYRGLGIDIEVVERVTADIESRVLTQGEKARNRYGQQGAALTFSAKEAGYKAIHPVMGHYIGFQEAEIDIHWEERGFAIRYLGDEADNQLLELGRGWFRFTGDSVITLFAIEARAGQQ